MFPLFQRLGVEAILATKGAAPKSDERRDALTIRGDSVAGNADYFSGTFLSHNLLITSFFVVFVYFERKESFSSVPSAGARFSFVSPDSFSSFSSGI